MNYKTLLESVSQFVLDYFDNHIDSRLIYHNKKHTQFVVDAVTQIANHYQLNDNDFFIVITAAWFHDVGYLIDADNHEAASAEIAKTYLAGMAVESGTISKIINCILATKMPQKPVVLLEKIICDADLFHLGLDSFDKKNKLLRKELNDFWETKISKPDWLQKNIEFLEHQQYFTDYCRILLDDGKIKNLKELKKKSQEEADDTVKKPTAILSKEESTSADHKLKKKDTTEKGVETMFKITSSNSQRLSNLADNKAHILITVNSIILSALISLVLRKLDENQFLIIPTFILLTVSLFSMIFSILATRPSLPEGKFTQEDISNKTVNLLFFGNFYKMNLDEYSNGMLMAMQDKNYLYGMLIKDVYSQGVVLGRKYNQLRIAYNIFMFGLIVAVAAFIIASLFRDQFSSIFHS
ncbi:MAG: Pycsar system effector family protein [Janthinobacterium lividum]